METNLLTERLTDRVNVVNNLDVLSSVVECDIHYDSQLILSLERRRIVIIVTDAFICIDLLLERCSIEVVSDYTLNCITQCRGIQSELELLHQGIRYPEQYELRVDG